MGLNLRLGGDLIRKRKEMALDIRRQILGAFLTISMFGMLTNMIMREHFEPVQVNLFETSNIRLNVIQHEKDVTMVAEAAVSKAPWEMKRELKPCWNRPVSDTEQPKGFITFSLSNGPEFHISQVANAAVIAWHLNATLVVPDIRGNKKGEKWNLQKIYDVDHFVKSLDGIVKIARDQPTEIATIKPEVMRIPDQVTEDYIVQHIEPVFRRKGYLRLFTFFPSVNMKTNKPQKTDKDLVACLAMFSTLKLQPNVQEVMDSMVGRLRTLSSWSGGQFIAVDLRLEVFGCKDTGSVQGKNCYSAEEVGDFLRNIGFNRDTIIYVTQPRWHEGLNALKDMFPKIYKKESIIPVINKDKFTHAESSELKKAIDFYICAQSDVFVPSISGLFYANVAGKRIASGKTQILDPDQVLNSTTASDFVSPFVSKKTHLAYSCFC